MKSRSKNRDISHTGRLTLPACTRIMKAESKWGVKSHPAVGGSVGAEICALAQRNGNCKCEMECHLINLASLRTFMVTDRIIYPKTQSSKTVGFILIYRSATF